MGFDPAYEGTPPWDIGSPQPAILQLVEAGEVKGSVLDVGCGTGEHTLLFASRGHEAWGVDLAPRAIAKARAKAEARASSAQFFVRDALELQRLGRTFDTLVDTGCFHVFDDEERSRYVRSLAAALRPNGVLHLLVFSDAEPGEGGPRRVREEEIRRAFADGWVVERLVRERFLSHLKPEGHHAWLASIRRT